MVRLLSTLILIFAVVLFPPAVLAFVSQDAVPGDHTYPVKRKLEEVILAAASVNPASKAWFSVDLTDRRFKESQALLGEGRNADQTLGELVTQTTAAQAQIDSLKDQGQKQKLQQDLQTDVKKYIVTLAQTQSTQPQSPTPSNTATPSQPSTAPTVTTQPPSQPTISPSQSTIPAPTHPLPEPSHSTQPAPATSTQIPPAPVLTSTTPSPSVPPPPSDDPQKVCEDVRNGIGTINDTIKKLCGLIDLTPSVSTPQEISPNTQLTLPDPQNPNSDKGSSHPDNRSDHGGDRGPKSH